MRLDCLISAILIYQLQEAFTAKDCYLQASCDQQIGSSSKCEGTNGTVVELYCSPNDSTHIWSSLTYEWRRDASRLNYSSEYVSFDPFNPSDAGQYQCRAYDGGNQTVYCGETSLTTKPYPTSRTSPNRNGDYNCAYIQHIQNISICEQLITADVGGFPKPNVTWLVSDTAVTDETLLTINDNGSASVDVQLWSQAEYRYKISLLAQNELGSTRICLWPESFNDKFRNWMNTSITHDSLRTKSHADVVVHTCSLDLNIGTFYICYSKDVKQLQGLELDEQLCCYCSEEGTMDCAKRYSNWRLNYSNGGSRCQLSLANVTQHDDGYYQCRVHVDGIPCKLRYGGILNVSVSNHSTSHKSWINSHIIVIIVPVSALAGTAVITLIIVYIACKMSRSRTTQSTSFGITGADSEQQPLVAQPEEDDPQQPAEESYPTEVEENYPTEGEQDTTSVPTTTCNTEIPRGATGSDQFVLADWQLGLPIQETCDIDHCDCINSVSRNNGVGHVHKVHIVHFDIAEASHWVDDCLIPLLQEMNVEEEFAIAGRFWLSEIMRMIKRGYKVIFVIAKDTIPTSQFEVTLHHIILKQNAQKPLLIPILFNCKRQDFEKTEIGSLLGPYTLLQHDDSNFCDRLKQSIYAP